MRHTHNNNVIHVLHYLWATGRAMQPYNRTTDIHLNWTHLIKPSILPSVLVVTYSKESLQNNLFFSCRALCVKCTQTVSKFLLIYKILQNMLVSPHKLADMTFIENLYYFRNAKKINLNTTSIAIQLYDATTLHKSKYLKILAHPLQIAALLSIPKCIASQQKQKYSLISHAKSLRTLKVYADFQQL